jgi:hypothetical protein
MFSPEWHLVQQESSLVSSCIYKGLTDLRLANIHDKGLFYSAFFNLAIGLERHLKLTLIIDFIQANGLTCPTSNYIRSFGHDLFRLLNACQVRSVALGVQCDLLFSTSTRKQEILQFLNDYSNGLRYHNLDSLQGRGYGRDPLATWNDIIVAIYTDEVSRRKKLSVEGQAQFIADTIRDTAIVVHHGLDQSPLNIDSFVQIPAQIDAAAPHAVYHIVEIVSEINRLHFAVADLTHQECSRQNRNDSVIPFVEESYAVLNNSRRYLLAKRRWP